MLCVDGIRVGPTHSSAIEATGPEPRFGLGCLAQPHYLWFAFTCHCICSFRHRPLAALLLLAPLDWAVSYHCWARHSLDSYSNIEEVFHSKCGHPIRTTSNQIRPISICQASLLFWYNTLVHWTGTGSRQLDIDCRCFGADQSRLCRAGPN